MQTSTWIHGQHLLSLQAVPRKYFQTYFEFWRFVVVVSHNDPVMGLNRCLDQTASIWKLDKYYRFLLVGQLDDILVEPSLDRLFWLIASST